MGLLTAAAGWLLEKLGSKIVERAFDRGLEKVGIFKATCQSCSQNLPRVEIPENRAYELRCPHCSHIGTVFVESVESLVIHQIQQAQIVVQSAQIVVQDSAGTQRPFFTPHQPPPTGSFTIHYGQRTNHSGTPSLPPQDAWIEYAPTQQAQATTRQSREEILNKYAPDLMYGCNARVCHATGGREDLTYASVVDHAPRNSGDARWYINFRDDLDTLKVQWEAREGEVVPINFGPVAFTVQISSIRGRNEDYISGRLRVCANSEELLSKQSDAGDKNVVTKDGVSVYVDWGAAHARSGWRSFAYSAGALTVLVAEGIVVDEGMYANCKMYQQQLPQLRIPD